MKRSQSNSASDYDNDVDGPDIVLEATENEPQDRRPAVECPACMSWAVPPVTLVPCGHTLCGHCFTTMRNRAQELIPAPRRTRVEPIVRCPGCRRTVTNYTVSDSLRRIVLEQAPTRVSHGPGADDTETTERLDSAFMDVWRRRLPEPGDPTLREIYDAHASDDDDIDEEIEEDVGESVLDGDLSDFDHYIRPVSIRALIQMTHRTTTNDDDTDVVDDLNDALGLINRRIPRDLRQWTPMHDGTELQYKYWRAPLTETIERAFIELMLTQGVVCVREQGGYLLTLPIQHRHHFERS